MSSVTVTQRRPSLSADANKIPSNLSSIDTYGDKFEVPDYSIKEILDAIPPHCYKRSAVRSLAYVARDLFFLGLFGYIGYNYIFSIPWLSVRILSWAIYSIVQGLFGTGIWVLAHECGHGAFSEYPKLNDFVGWVLHSSLLVPYFSWKISHSKHHKATGHMDRDMVFVPRSREQFMSIHDYSEDAPIVTLYHLLTQQLFGWLVYLTTNVTGQTYPNRSKWVTNHYAPSSPLFSDRDRIQIILSDLGILLTLSTLYFASVKYGVSTVFLMYGLPWIWVNHWLVHITFLQHTDPRLPHYEAQTWTFARGAAATIDRDFGFIGRHIFHDIIETHVMHHYVSRLPFYNCREATEAIKKVMGKHYRKDDSNFVTSLYRVARTCQFVEGEKGVLMFRNFNKVGVPPASQGQRLDS